MNVRNYHINDLNALILIMKKNIPVYFAPSEIIDFITFLKSVEYHRYKVVEVEGQIIGGCGLLEQEGGIGKISWIMFDPDYQRSGMGTNIVNELIQEYFKTGGSKVVAYTSNVAYLFFKKLGFQSVYSKADYWGKGLDLVYMELMVK